MNKLNFNFDLYIKSLCLALALSAGLALAKEEQKVAKRTSVTDAKGNKVQIIDFNDAKIEGKAMAPDGFMLTSRKPGSYKTVLELRKNFRTQVKNTMHEGLLLDLSSD